MPKKEYYWQHKEKLSKISREKRLVNHERTLKKEQDYRDKNREKCRYWFSNCWRVKAKSRLSCMVCGFTKALDFCHLKWRKDGGKLSKKNVTILCPNHHRLFDQNRLTDEELRLIKPVETIICQT